jgi:ATP-dependent helicase/nuclease subunit A
MSNLPQDQAQRIAALDPSQSFIVQAPAGSGKTTLLVKRYLTLLTTVAHPEEILAITFTKKAASEMRERILQALQSTSDEDILAQKVLQHSERLHWDLLSNPNRLRIMTIDAFCAQLTKQMPITAKFGAQPNINEAPEALYQQAAQALLQDLENTVEWSDAIAKLLSHLDNHYPKVESLLIAMLKKRDQWLPNFTELRTQKAFRKRLEQSLYHTIQNTLQQLDQMFSQDEKQILLRLVQYASNMSQKMSIDSPLSACAQLTQWPDTTAEMFPYWHALAHLLLIQNGKQWRKTVNKNLGFPSAAEKNLTRAESEQAATMKQEICALLESLQDKEELRSLLHECLHLPPSQYTQTQWEIITALLDLLPVLAAHLTVQFSMHAQVDFIEVALAALNALGEIDNPSDLALYLDYKIQHILIDEFQDTSITQFNLLERLISGWQPDDQRTLFLVGDPMQSIYRFRAAEVGLFLRAQQRPIGLINLIPLSLQVNFRSSKKLIEWNNYHCAKIFPQQENIATGAVPYSHAIAFNSNHDASQVYLHPNFNSTLPKQQTLLKRIQHLIHTSPDASIAVLVRARNHIFELLPLLKQAQISYHAIEIESLQHSSTIQDLLALTRALLQPADRIAWLALLRAPWLGLSLNDIYHIAHTDTPSIIWQRLQHYTEITQLSATAKQRLANFVPIINQALQNRQRHKLHHSIRALWLTLGGPACVDRITALQDAQHFFDCLQQLEQGNDLINIDQLENKVTRLYAAVNTQEKAQLQIMTIHKAKGLEFDYVLLPSLESASPPDEHQLLTWLELPSKQQTQVELLLAPIKSSEEQQDPIYQFIRRQDYKKSQYEVTRLFYVALTRAKKGLELFFNVETKKDTLCKPKSGSFLSQLWPHILPSMEKQWQACLQQPMPTEAADHIEISHTLRRLPINWQSPLHTLQSSSSHHSQPTAPTVPKPIASENNDELSRQVGNLVHRIIYQIAEQGAQHWSVQRLQQQLPLWKRYLQAFAPDETALSQATQRVFTATKNLLQDKRGLWILDVTHQEARNEYVLNTLSQQGVVNKLIIDRTFIDADNLRWIIDYKTSQAKSGQSLDAFLRQRATTICPSA